MCVFKENMGNENLISTLVSAPSRTKLLRGEGQLGIAVVIATYSVENMRDKLSA